MIKFSDLGIKPQTKGFEGEKIKIDKILNKEVIVEDFKIEASKYEKGSGKCLYIQIELNGDKRVVFTGSTTLMDMIQQVPKDKFPFTATIIKNNADRFELT